MRVSPPTRARQTAPLPRRWTADVPPSPTGGIPAGRTSRNFPQTGLYSVSREWRSGMGSFADEILREAEFSTTFL